MSLAQAGAVGDFRVSKGGIYQHEDISTLDVNVDLQCELLAIPVLSDSEELGTNLCKGRRLCDALQLSSSKPSGSSRGPCSSTVELEN